jgi:hypothetical protein
MARALPVPESWNVAQVGPFVAVAAAQRNYRPRRCLGGLNAKDIYRQKQRRGRWNQRQCHEAFEWISSRAKAILERRMKSDQRSIQAAWRDAVEAWLSDQALIEVH